MARSTAFLLLLALLYAPLLLVAAAASPVTTSGAAGGGSGAAGAGGCTRQGMAKGDCDKAANKCCPGLKCVYTSVGGGYFCTK